MADGRPKKTLNQATSQRTRWREAPAPARVKVDGRSLADLLAFGAEYGALITFYDLADKPDGDWSIFFRNDPSIALALVASLDVGSIATALRREIAALRQIHGTTRRLEALRRIIGVILRLVRILDNGASVPGAASLSKAIAHEVQSFLSSELRNFAIRTTAISPAPDLHIDLAGLSDLWGVSRPVIGSGDIGYGGDWFREIIAALEDLVAVMIASLTRLSAQARDQLASSLEAQGHAPQSALYDAFAKLFGHAQNTVNEFPRRLVEYYYGTVLKQSSRREAPDQVYLTFAPNQGIAETDVPKGTIFPAGTEDDGTAINYAADRSLEVYDSNVAALRTLRTTANQLLSGTVALADKAPAIADPFPPFGASEAGEQGSLTSSCATLGFAMASNTLMLAGGDRRVDLRLQIGLASWAKLQRRLAPLARQLGLGAEAVLAQLMQASFSLQRSAAGGWIAVPGFTVVPDTDSRNIVLVLSFTLADGAAPLVALSTLPADPDATPPTGPVPSQDLPVLMANLIQDPVTLRNGDASVQVFPYPIMAEVALDTLAIYVNVQNFGALALTTANGPADASQPFATLGSPPVQFATLEMTSPELFLKRLDYLTLANDWYGIPTGATGFSGYYQAYVEDADGNPLDPIDNSTFLSTVTVNNPGYWTLGQPKQVPGNDAALYLFQTTEGNPVTEPCAPLKGRTVFEKLPVTSATPPPQYDPALSAIVLTLTEPPYAFGDTLYARNVMAASLRETALAAACAQKCAQPKSDPPEMKALAASLDAVATANSDTPARQYRQAVADAASKALSQMTGTVFTLLGDAPGLDAALAGGRTQGAQDDLFAEDGGPSSADVAMNLARWISQNSATVRDPATRDTIRRIVEAQSHVIDAVAEAARPPVAAARAKVTAALFAARTALRTPDPLPVKECIAQCMGADPARSYPNVPWLPMTSAVTLHYAGLSALPNQPVAGDAYYYLEPFDSIAAVDWTTGSGEVPLLQPQADQGALFIGLTGQPEYLSLLMQVTAGALGFSTNPPAVSWAQQSAAGWSALTPPDTLQGNGTEGTSTDSSLQNTGIVSLKLAPPTADLLWLKLGIASGADSFPLLAGITTNALTATWIGPGGAQTLGLQPLPAGTIAASDPPLADIASIDQPLPSFGGHPRLERRPFWMWMAERLRHKDRAIDSWDYARLALSEFPTLWQAEALPAQDEEGRQKPGHVDLIVVPGPATPNIADATIPLADQSLLEEINVMAAARCSTFVTLAVDNPLYVRVIVTADLVFSPADTVAAWCAKLNGELIAWLSPWEPPPDLGTRPDDYTSDIAIAEFVRARPYVVAIMSLALAYDPPDEAAWCYLTSAAKHDLTGELAT